MMLIFISVNQLKELLDLLISNSLNIFQCLNISTINRKSDR